MAIDVLDARLITLISEEAGISVVECARRLGIARATAQGRLDRLRKTGVIKSMAPHIDPVALGFPIRCFCSVQIDQRIGHDRVSVGLEAIPELLELHTATGDADLFAAIVARSTHDLQRVLDLVATAPGVIRVSSQLVLGTHFMGRTLPLVKAALITPA
ncbi:Lrp/AsnC family transcriptional regulator [Leucobacter sp. 1207-22]|uniref:Lrp/AsnC family transcriptional regulator n=1 Tax=Leucobacter sp. 1207-22 TaxID=2604456 RepID=UPI00406457E9